jgi:MFS family permease
MLPTADEDGTAALMLAGAKLGDILGRDRTFAIGLAVYGAGSLTTALSPNLTVLLIGWSFIEGLGAALVMPAIVSLVAGTYSGKQRALAFGIVGGVAGAAIAAGPLIGGWVTTEFSWRYVFAGETVIVAVILLLRRRLKSSRPPSTRRGSTWSAWRCRRRGWASWCSGSSRAASGA